HEPQPQFVFVALDFPRHAIDESRRTVRCTPGAVIRRECRAQRWSENAAAEIIAHGRAMHHYIILARADVIFEKCREIVEGSVANYFPVLLPRRGPVERIDRFWMGSQQDAVMTATVRTSRDTRAGAAGENVGQAAHPINHDLRVAG